MSSPRYDGELPLTVPSATRTGLENIPIMENFVYGGDASGSGAEMDNEEDNEEDSEEEQREEDEDPYPGDDGDGGSQGRKRRLPTYIGDCKKRTVSYCKRLKTIHRNVSRLLTTCQESHVCCSVSRLTLLATHSRSTS